MRRAWCCFAIELTLCLSAAAVTIEDRRVHVAIQADGSLRESSRLVARLDDADDLASWSTYRVYLNENRTLERLTARVELPDGRRIETGPEDQERIEYSGDAVFHASSQYQLVRLPPLVVGARVIVEEVVRSRPYYPTSKVLLRGAGRVERTEVVIEGGAPETFRWELLGPSHERDAWRVERALGGVRLEATALPAHPPGPLSADGADTVPLVRFGWGGDGTWQDVGRWYRQLVTTLPSPPAEVIAEARRLTAGQTSPRERLATLTRFVQSKIRYVAVEVGVGGYRPSDSGTTFARRWGDCKDKSLLLVEMLDAVGIEAHLALVLASTTARVDSAFPSPEPFNHAIVAVERAAIEAPATGVGEGRAKHLFLDPTQRRGGSDWLQPLVQDQLALVVRDHDAVLERTPIEARHEERVLEAELDVDEAGDARGVVRLKLRGALARTFLSEVESMSAAAAAESARAVLATLLPGATFDQLGLQPGSGVVPRVTLVAGVQLPGWVRGLPSRPSLQLPPLRVTPPAQWLRGHRGVAVSQPGRVSVAWRVQLPEEACRTPVRPTGAMANSAGRLEQEVVVGHDGELSLTRTAALERRWFDQPSLLSDLEALALAEQRAARRLIRFRCTEQSGSALSGGR